MSLLAHHFGNDSRYAHSESARRKQWFIKARQEKAHSQELDDRAAENATAFSVSAVLASDIQIAEFESRLDLYDEATIRALEENQIRMDDVKRQLLDIETQFQDMLDRAYVMEDGRRVFLTEDRTQAFDENGVEISPDELDFDLVPEGSPTWESVSEKQNELGSLRQEFDRLEAERSGILSYQEKLDAARERIGEGGVTTDELDDLDAELADAMPPSVKAHTPGFDTADNAPSLKSEFTIPSGVKPLVTANTPAVTPEFSPAG